MTTFRTGLLALVCATAVIGACTGSPTRAPATDPAAAEAARIAASMVGKPYRYGGRSPASGFDCSGLVYFSFARAGMDVPRSTRQQVKASAPVPRRALRPGDLVFFDQEGRKSSHVGIYVGSGRFVHAPSSGKRVRTDSLSDNYWQRHFASARRFREL
ncbi:MAG TPA: C40 family peptidase [Acidiferrobacterales bacterium]